MKRVIKITVPVDFKIEYEDSGVSLEQLFSCILDGAGAAGWEIQDTLNEFLKEKAAFIENASANIDVDKCEAHDYPKLNTGENYSNLEFEIEPTEVIIVN